MLCKNGARSFSSLFERWLPFICHRWLSVGGAAVAWNSSERATNPSKADKKCKDFLYFIWKIEKRLLAHSKLNPEQKLIFYVIHLNKSRRFAVCMALLLLPLMAITEYTQYTFFSVYLKLSRNKNKIHGSIWLQCETRWHCVTKSWGHNINQISSSSDFRWHSAHEFRFSMCSMTFNFFSIRFTWSITTFFCIVRFIFDIRFRRHIDRSPFIYWHESAFVVHLDFRVSIYNSYGSSQWYFICFIYCGKRLEPAHRDFHLRRKVKADQNSSLPCLDLDNVSRWYYDTKWNWYRIRLSEKKKARTKIKWRGLIAFV